MKYVLGMLTFWLAFNASANIDEDSTATNASSEPWTFKGAQKIIKISPLDIFSVVSTLGLDVEMKLKNRSSLQIGAAVVPSFMQVLAGEEFNAYDRMGGYKLRAESRFYTPNFSKFYFAAGISFRHLIIRDEVAIGMEGVSNGVFEEPDFAYFVNTPMVFNRFNSNIDAKWGLQLETEGNFAFDFYCGLSFRTVFVQTNSTIPEGGRIAEMRGAWTLNDNHRFFYPIPIFGVKIGIIK